MVESRKDILKGTLDMLILKTLSLAPLHGLGISRRIEQITDGVFQVKPGSLFPGAAPDGAGGVDRGLVGRVGEQPPREVLPPDSARVDPASEKSGKVGPTRGRPSAGCSKRAEEQYDAVLVTDQGDVSGFDSVGMRWIGSWTTSCRATSSSSWTEKIKGRNGRRSRPP